MRGLLKIVGGVLYHLREKVPFTTEPELTGEVLNLPTVIRRVSEHNVRWFLLQSPERIPIRVGVTPLLLPQEITNPEILWGRAAGAHLVVGESEQGYLVFLLQLPTYPYGVLPCWVGVSTHYHFSLIITNK